MDYRSESPFRLPLILAHFLPATPGMLATNLSYPAPRETSPAWLRSQPPIPYFNASHDSPLPKEAQHSWPQPACLSCLL